ncbi:hypothetical protein Dip510_001719 [Elusimicrobium posterum]|uniref:hypothetical protein n=1 Tax=Elusimicrobium posterum TaxID=3116653 RepID=UPI003C774B73
MIKKISLALILGLLASNVFANDFLSNAEKGLKEFLGVEKAMVYDFTITDKNKIENYVKLNENFLFTENSNYWAKPAVVPSDMFDVFAAVKKGQQYKSFPNKVRTDVEITKIYVSFKHYKMIIKRLVGSGPTDSIKDSEATIIVFYADGTATISKDDALTGIKLCSRVQVLKPSSYDKIFSSQKDMKEVEAPYKRPRLKAGSNMSGFFERKKNDETCAFVI